MPGCLLFARFPCPLGWGLDSHLKLFIQRYSILENICPATPGLCVESVSSSPTLNYCLKSSDAQGS